MSHFADSPSLYLTVLLCLSAAAAGEDRIKQSQVSCSADQLHRFDCYPEGNPDSERCTARGCCWQGEECCDVNREIQIDWKQWGLCVYVIVHTILPPSPVVLWIDLGGKPKWLPLNFGYHDVMRTALIGESWRDNGYQVNHPWSLHIPNFYDAMVNVSEHVLHKRSSHKHNFHSTFANTCSACKSRRILTGSRLCCQKYKRHQDTASWSCSCKLCQVLTSHKNLFCWQSSEFLAWVRTASDTF